MLNLYIDFYMSKLIVFLDSAKVKNDNQKI